MNYKKKIATLLGGKLSKIKIELQILFFNFTGFRYCRSCRLHSYIISI